MRPKLHFFYEGEASCSPKIKDTKAYRKHLQDNYPPIICAKCFSIVVRNFNTLVKDGLYNYIYREI